MKTITITTAIVSGIECDGHRRSLICYPALPKNTFLLMALQKSELEK